MKINGKNSIILKEVESTNNYANQLILSNAADEGTVVLAQYQKMGRGQPGNGWESEAGKNLLYSIILFPGFLPAPKQFLLSKIVSLAIVGFLRGEADNVAIKWPNDLYIGNSKVAGILIENGIKGNNLFSSVLGIGLNLNQEIFVSDAPNPVSLKQLTGKTYEVEMVANNLTNLIFKWYEKLKEGQFDEVNSAYFSNLFRKNVWSKFKVQNLEFEAKIVGIGEFGQLLLEDRTGIVAGYMFKEVEFVR